MCIYIYTIGELKFLTEKILKFPSRVGKIKPKKSIKSN